VTQVCIADAKLTVPQAASARPDNSSATTNLLTQ
jgi:hypothetical protein